VEHRCTAYARGSSPRSPRRSVVAGGGPPTGASDSHSSGRVLLLATRCIPSATGTGMVDFGRGLSVLHPEDPEACSSDTELMIREREVLFSVH